jgi:hypothetical protein
MPKKSKGIDIATMSEDEKREAGIPYLVDEEQLTMLGLDPARYYRPMKTMGGELDGLECHWLDRVKDADVIERLRTMRDDPLSDARN